MFARHDLVWLSDEGWQAACRDAQDEARPAIVKWHRVGYPAVVRRLEPDAGDGVVCAGIALPPEASGAKKRIPLCVSAQDVRKTSAPIRLEDALPSLPGRWQPELASLMLAADLHRVRYHVYGSAALQALTGMDYVTAASDIDLLFQPATRAELDGGLKLLAAYAHSLPLDGEVIFPGGAAVAWKEWTAAVDAPGKPRVLVKENRHVRLMTTADLLHTLEEETCTSP